MPQLPLGNRDFMRSINRSLILNLIKTLGPISRAEVAKRSGLSPATVTIITAELINEGLIFEKEPGDSRGGRRPILLALDPNGGYVVGAKLTETHLIGALTDLEATVLAKQEKPLKGLTPEEVAETLAELVDDLLDSAQVQHNKLIGVGVGLAGIVDSDRGLLRRSPFFGWIDLPLRDLLQERVSAPVSIDNDVNTLTLAERWFGVGHGVDHFLTITVGRGIGMGIVVNGQFYRGAGGGAGELGHTLVDPQGPDCACGKRGCLETFVAEPGLVRQANERLRSEQVESADELLALAEAGNPVAKQVFAQAGELLGQAVANLVDLLNPRLIIIGGEGVRLGNYFFEPMRAAIQRYCMPGLSEDALIRVEPWGDDAWARGAASLVLRDLFESPMYREQAAELA